MAFYKINRATQGGNELGDAIDKFRSAWYGLANAVGHLNQMTDSEVTSYYGFSDDTESASAKSELQADIGRMQNADAGVNGAQVTGGLVQMLQQFG